MGGKKAHSLSLSLQYVFGSLVASGRVWDSRFDQAMTDVDWAEPISGYTQGQKQFALSVDTDLEWRRGQKDAIPAETSGDTFQPFTATRGLLR